MSELVVKGQEPVNITLGVESTAKSKFKLDNAATGFSLLANKRVPVVYRLSVDFKEEIDKQILKQAIIEILPRFPFFRASINKGFFWGKWVTNLSTPEILPEVQYTNQYIPLGKNRLLYRIFVNQKRLAIEFHHALTDGTGSMTFFKSIISSYLKLKLNNNCDWGKLFCPDDEIINEEFENAFDLNYIKKMKEKPLKHKGKSFNIPLKTVKTGVFHITRAIISVEEIRKKAKEYNISISVFLTAVYLDSLREIQQNLYNIKKKIKPIRINISVDLRRIFPSKTMRIFSLLTTLNIDPRKEQLDFKKIIGIVEDQLREDVKPERFQQKIAQNIRNLSSPIMKITPFQVKRFFARHGYYFVRTPKYGGILSNLGLQKLPRDFEKHIEHFDIIVGPSPVNKVRIGVVSFKDKMSITFGRIIDKPILAEAFCKKLYNHSIKVTLESYKMF